jgi:hypothetical protein
LSAEGGDLGDDFFRGLGAIVVPTQLQEHNSTFVGGFHSARIYGKEGEHRPEDENHCPAIGGSTEDWIGGRRGGPREPEDAPDMGLVALELVHDHR